MINRPLEKKWIKELVNPYVPNPTRSIAILTISLLVLLSFNIRVRGEEEDEWEEFEIILETYRVQQGEAVEVDLSGHGYDENWSNDITNIYIKDPTGNIRFSLEDLSFRYYHIFYYNLSENAQLGEWSIEAYSGDNSSLLYECIFEVIEPVIFVKPSAVNTGEHQKLKLYIDGEYMFYIYVSTGEKALYDFEDGFGLNAGYHTFRVEAEDGDVIEKEILIEESHDGQELYLGEIGVEPIDMTLRIHGERYGGTYDFVPGDEMVIELTGDPNAQMWVAIYYEDHEGEDTETENIKKNWSSVKTDDHGDKILRYTIPDSFPDGDYSVVAFRSDVNGFLDYEDFVIKTYELTLDPEYEAFVKGEVVTVDYEVRNIDGGELVTEGYGEWKALFYEHYYDFEELASGTFTDLEGSFQFDTKGFSDEVETIRIKAWFNDSKKEEPVRWDTEYIQVKLGEFSIDVYTDKEYYCPGDVLKASVTTSVQTDSYGYYGPGVPLPYCTVESIELLYRPPEKYGSDKDTDWQTMDELTKENLVTDHYGQVGFFFIIPEDAEDDGSYRVKASTTRNETVTELSRILTIDANSNFFFFMDVDKESYISGETLLVNFTPYNIDLTTSVNYRYDIEDRHTDKSLKKGSTDKPYLKYSIPENFVGYLEIDVEARTDDGHEADGYERVEVNIGYILINVQEDGFKGGQPLHIEYEVRSEILKNPEICYEIVYSSDPLESGTLNGTNGSFVYKVPEVPPDKLDIRIYAEGKGRTLYESVAVYEAVDLRIAFDVNSTEHRAGENITVDFEVLGSEAEELGEEPMGFDFGLVGVFPTSTFQTFDRKGTFQYSVPEHVRPGEYEFEIYSEGMKLYSRTISVSNDTKDAYDVKDGASADSEESVLVRTKIFDISLFIYMLGLLLLIILIIAVVLIVKRRRAYDHYYEDEGSDEEEADEKEKGEREEQRKDERAGSRKRESGGGRVREATAGRKISRAGRGNAKGNVCKRCGNVMHPPNAVFCTNCGFDNRGAAPGNRPALANRCIDCGAPVKPPLVFCSRCMRNQERRYGLPSVLPPPPPD